MPKINWRKAWSYLAGLAFLCLMIKDPAEAKSILVWLWHVFYVVFGWILTEFFQWLGHELSRLNS